MQYVILQEDLYSTVFIIFIMNEVKSCKVSSIKGQLIEIQVGTTEYLTDIVRSIEKEFDLVITSNNCPSGNGSDCSTTVTAITKDTRKDGEGSEKGGINRLLETIYPEGAPKVAALSKFDDKIEIHECKCEDIDEQ